LIATNGYSYIYDGDGQRVKKCTEGTTPGSCATSATGTLYWRGLGSDPLTETDLSGNLQNNYIFFHGQRVARNDSSGGLHYYFSDHLGSHGVVENATGSACEQDIDYYPYGGQENDYCTTPIGQNYKFTGKERDTESGLDNFGARYDSSSLGRFMTPDWSLKPTSVPYASFGDPQTLNLYTYVENSPLNRIDADGHDDNDTVKKPVMMGGLGGERPCDLSSKVDGENLTAQNTSSGGFWQKLGNALSGNGWKTDTEVKQGQSTSPTIPIVAAGAGLAPRANGPAQAASDMAKNFMKNAKPDPPLRGLPGETPDITKMSPERELAKKALEVLGGIGAKLANGATEVMGLMPMPHILVQQAGPHQYDPSVDP
jgi:RHS repeat-associated protein